MGEEGQSSERKHEDGTPSKQEKKGRKNQGTVDDSGSEDSLDNDELMEHLEDMQPLDEGVL